MFNRDYLEKLKQYVGKDIQLVESDNEVHIYLKKHKVKKRYMILLSKVCRN